MTDGKGNNVTADSLDSGVNELTALLNKHKNHIELLKTKVKDLLVDNADAESDTVYDDIWVLRYVLSNIKGSPASDKGIKQAENSMRRSILWRKDNAKLLNLF